MLRDESTSPSTWEGVRKGCNTMLDETVASYLKPITKVAENGFEISGESGETGKCFLMRLSE